MEPQADGVPLREHLRSVYRQTRIMPELLRPISGAEDLNYVWEYFLDMSKRRTGNGMGENAISWEGLIAWAQLKGIRLSAFELWVLDMLETMYLRRKCA